MKLTQVQGLYVDTLISEYGKYSDDIPQRFLNKTYTVGELLAILRNVRTYGIHDKGTSELINSIWADLPLTIKSPMSGN